MSENGTQQESLPNTPAYKMILEMFRIQNQLNTKSYAKEWLEKGATEEFDYSLAAGQELGEFFNSLPYSWWSDPTEDRRNCITEIIDAWHFIMSQLIIDYKGDVDYCAVFANNVYESFTAKNFGREMVGKDAARKAAKGLTARLYLNGQKGVDNVLPSYITLFWALCHAYEVPLELLYARYVGKSVLNRFRVDNGYKRKEYDKKWVLYRGVDKKATIEEDNFFLSEYIDEAVATGLPVDDESVYAWLTMMYGIHKSNTTLATGESATA